MTTTDQDYLDAVARRKAENEMALTSQDFDDFIAKFGLVGRGAGVSFLLATAVATFGGQLWQVSFVLIASFWLYVSHIGSHRLNQISFLAFLLTINHWLAVVPIDRWWRAFQLIVEKMPAAVCGI